jgi:hypothetical protein
MCLNKWSSKCGFFECGQERSPDPCPPPPPLLGDKPEIGVPNVREIYSKLS